MARRSGYQTGSYLKTLKSLPLLRIKLDLKQQVSNGRTWGELPCIGEFSTSLQIYDLPRYFLRKILSKCLPIHLSTATSV
jgi:hypothetical protein